MSTWDNVMENLGAVRDENGGIRHFGPADVDVTAEGIAVAGHLAVIRVSGADAQTFLQGQVTTDVRDVSQGAVRTAMHLSLKGRGLVSMRVLPDGNGGFLMVLPASLADSCMEKLKKFVLLSKAELKPDPDAVVLVASGAAASENLVAAGFHPPAPGEAIVTDGVVLASPAERRWLLVTAPDRAATLWPALSAGLSVGGADQARLAEIIDGEGHVYPGGEERFMPQELNYDLTGGISFRKGCYVGQEVVARMHFKGKLKQRMHHLSWADAEHTPGPGTPLRNADGKAVGEVVNAVVAGERCHALVVLRLGHDGPLLQDDRAIDWRAEPLPYELPEE